MVRIGILKFEVRAEFVLRVGSNDFGQNATAVRQTGVLTDNLLTVSSGRLFFLGTPFPDVRNGDR